MRLFWVFIGLLVAVAGWLWLADTRESVDPSPLNASMNTPTAEVPEPGSAARGSADLDPATQAPTVVSDSSSAASLAEDLLASAERSLDANDAQDAPATAPASSGAPGETHDPTPAAPTEYVPAGDQQAAAERAKTAKIEPQADGSVLLDEKYMVSGSGSAEDPYRISWDLLTSASETYQPRLGLTQIPQRVGMLNGKHVQITGYMAFPLAQMEASEVLVMLNMWDGCCIGIPPSPYDAIEVKLAEAIPYDKRRFINYGTLTGVMKVDPYLVNDWLLGLYLVEDATLDLGM